jgi:hypothetical protein
VPTVTKLGIPLFPGVGTSELPLGAIPEECLNASCTLKNEYMGALLAEEPFEGSFCAHDIESTHDKMRVLFLLNELSLSPLVSYGLQLTGGAACTNL